MSPLNCQKIASSGQCSRSHCFALALFVSTLFVIGPASGADLSQAVVKEKVNMVTLAPSLTGEARSAGPGAVIHDKNVVRTGTGSRAALEFADLTIARLGANALFTFDAKARVMSVTQGAVLFSKPTNSGTIQVQAGAVSGAITGSTGFISNVRRKGTTKTAADHPRMKEPGSTTVIGMLEGKFRGGTRWIDRGGHEHTAPFQLGPGQILVARMDGPPRIAQVDLPRFIKSSPLVKGFKQPLPNAAKLDQAVADCQADERGGLVNQTNIMLVTSQPLDVTAAMVTKTQDAGFLNVGGTGVIRGQLVWTTDADLDLYLTLPNGQQVSFKNVSVTFNNGRAIAMLDHDNLGNTIDVPPNIRVENLVVNGVPLAGLYSFLVNNFNTQNGSDAFTLRVNYNGQTQVITGNVSNGQTSPPVTVKVPGG